MEGERKRSIVVPVGEGGIVGMGPEVFARRGNERPVTAETNRVVGVQGTARPKSWLEGWRIY